MCRIVVFLLGPGQRTSASPAKVVLAGILGAAGRADSDGGFHGEYLALISDPDHETVHAITIPPITLAGTAP